jgi:hypothetical protein
MQFVSASPTAPPSPDGHGISAAARGEGRSECGYARQDKVQLSAGNLGLAWIKDSRRGISSQSSSGQPDGCCGTAAVAVGGKIASSAVTCRSVI